MALPAVDPLAGAPDRPALGMISARGGWRSKLDRDDSPWYPVLLPFRRSRLDDWSGLLSRVADALAFWSPGREPAARLVKLSDVMSVPL